MGKEGGSGGGDTATQLLLRSKMKGSLLRTEDLAQTKEDKQGFLEGSRKNHLGELGPEERRPPRRCPPGKTPVLPATGLPVRWYLAASWDSSLPTAPFLGSQPAVAPGP